MVLQGLLDPDASRATRLNQLLQVAKPELEEESAESDFEDTEAAPTHSKCQLLEKPSVPLGEADEYNFVAHKITGTIHVVQKRRYREAGLWKTQDHQHGPGGP